MNKAETILAEVRKNTDEVILFSSVIGKDSILLTHYCARAFRRVVCVYMYGVKNLGYISKLQNYYKARFPNIEYIDLPHYVMASHIKTGHMGIKKNPDQKFYTLADIDKLARDMTGLDWSIYGMKKNDSMNRRLQLNTYENGICEPTQKAYPLQDFNNKQIFSLIRHHRLPNPPVYRSGQSSGEVVENAEYLGWLFDNYPEDLKKTLKAYPGAKSTLYEYQYKQDQGK